MFQFYNTRFITKLEVSRVVCGHPLRLQILPALVVSQPQHCMRTFFLDPAFDAEHEAEQAASALLQVHDLTPQRIEKGLSIARAQPSLPLGPFLIRTT